MLMQETAQSLGPATVVGAADRRVQVRLPDGAVVEARPAFALPYRPNPGDEVLAIGQGEQYYLIGVLEAGSKTVLAFPGDAELRVPNGTLKLVSGKGVTVSGPTIGMRANKIEIFAQTLFQRVANAFHWARELLQIRAGRTRTAVEGTSHHTAEHVVVRAKGDVKIDGEKIHLG